MGRGWGGSGRITYTIAGRRGQFATVCVRKQVIMMTQTLFVCCWFFVVVVCTCMCVLRGRGECVCVCVCV